MTVNAEWRQKGSTQQMTHWLNETMQHWQAGEGLVAAATHRLAQDWTSSADFVCKLRTGAERWHAAMHEIDATVTLADIFRTRVTFP